MKNNPARPFDSPISVSHAGGWDDEKYRHEISPELSRPAKKPIPNRIKHLRGFDEVDENLEQAIKEDLQRRNLKNPKSK